MKFYIILMTFLLLSTNLAFADWKEFIPKIDLEPIQEKPAKKQNQEQRTTPQSFSQPRTPRLPAREQKWKEERAKYCKNWWGLSTYGGVYTETPKNQTTKREELWTKREEYNAKAREAYEKLKEGKTKGNREYLQNRSFTWFSDYCIRFPKVASLAQAKDVLAEFHQMEYFVKGEEVKNKRYVSQNRLKELGNRREELCRLVVELKTLVPDYNETYDRYQELKQQREMAFHTGKSKTNDPLEFGRLEDKLGRYNQIMDRKEPVIKEKKKEYYERSKAQFKTKEMCIEVDTTKVAYKDLNKISRFSNPSYKGP